MCALWKDYLVWKIIEGCSPAASTHAVKYTVPSWVYLLLFAYLASDLWTASRICCSCDPTWCLCFIWVNIFSEGLKSGCILCNWENESGFMTLVGYTYVILTVRAYCCLTKMNARKRKPGDPCSHYFLLQNIFQTEKPSCQLDTFSSIGKNLWEQQKFWGPLLTWDLTVWPHLSFKSHPKSKWEKQEKTWSVKLFLKIPYGF